MPYKRGRKWLACVKRQGVKRYATFPTKTEARRWEDEQKALPSEQFLNKIGSGYSLANWAEDYLEFAERFTSKTFKEKRATFKRMFREIDPARSVESFSPDDALKYLKVEFKARGGNAANKDRKNGAAAWEWGRVFKKMPILNPFRVVPKFPGERSPRYVPPLDSFLRVIECAKGADRVMLLCCLHLGARRGEIFRMRWEDVDFVGQRVRLWTRKREDGSLEFDYLPLTDELAESLRGVFVDGAEWVFPNPKTKPEAPYTDRRKWLTGLCESAGVRPFGLHGIRHLAASLLADEGVSMKSIQGILRHKKVSTTERYLHQLGDLRGAVEVLERKGKVVVIGRKGPTMGLQGR